jgi:hypothetical protein
MFKMLKKERGIAMVTILILLGIISALIASLILMSRTEMWLSVFGSKQRQALYMAETGKEQFIAAIPFTGTLSEEGSLHLLTATGSYLLHPFPATEGRTVMSGADQGVLFATEVIGMMPIGNNGQIIRRTIEIEVIFRTYEAGKSYQTPRYPWE